MKKMFATFLSLLLVTSVLAGCAQSSSPSGTSSAPGGNATANSASDSSAPKGDKVTITVGHGLPDTVGMHKGWVKFKEEIEKSTDGRITVDIYSNNQLGGDRELTESTQIGNITACTPSPSPVASFCPEFYVLDIPFLFADRESTYEILDGEAGQKLLDSLESVGLKGLGYMENGFRNFTNSRNPIHKPEDVKGLKLRTMENKIHIAFWSLAGASPTPMAFGEVFTALQQKTIDAQENPWEVIHSAKLYEVQKYITETQHIYSPLLVLFNLDFYNSLSGEDQKLVEDAMKIAIQVAREESTQNDEEFKAQIAETGVELTALSAEEKVAFREVMSPVIDQIRELAGDEIVDSFIRAANY